MNLPGEKRRLEWDRGSAEIWALSGAIHHLEMALPDGRCVRPLAEAPWHGDAATTGDAGIPAHLRFLGGEWPCVPFGRGAADPVVHGYGTDNCWRFGDPSPSPGLRSARPTSPRGGEAAAAAAGSSSPCRGVDESARRARSGEGAVALSIAYPSTHPVASLSRTIAPVSGQARIDFTLAVEARAACALPVGLHPILALGRRNERVRIEGAFSHGESFPVVFEPGVSRLAPAARFAGLDALPLAKGGAIAFGDLLNDTTEEAFQSFGVDGALRVVYPDSGYAVRLEWNPDDFPTVLFWVSTGGRTHKPWNGRFRGFGVEPLNARFGARDGQAFIAEGKTFLADERWTTQYSLFLEPL